MTQMNRNRIMDIESRLVFAKVGRRWRRDGGGT